MFFKYAINDVTTTPEDPPAFKMLGTFKYPPINRAIQNLKCPDIKPLRKNMTADVLFGIVKEIVKAERWEVAHIDEKSGRIEAVAATPFLRFKDDVVIEIRRDGPISTVHMRSRSRVGRHDFGVNAKRIRGFLKTLLRNIGDLR